MYNVIHVLNMRIDYLIRTIIELPGKTSNKSKLLSSQKRQSQRNGAEKLLLFRVPVAVGVLGLPAPATVSHMRAMSYSAVSAQLVLGLRGVGVALRDVAGAPGHDAGNLVTARSLEGVNRRVPTGPSPCPG